MDKPMIALDAQQQALTAYLRDPEHRAPPAGMDRARAEIYRELVFDNLQSLLSGTFPVLRSVLGETDWRRLLRVFLREHRCATPKFGEIAGEFVAWMASTPAGLQDGSWPAFMVELSHYEWIEMALQQTEAEPLPASDPERLLTQPLRLSPLAWPLAYAWPVQRLGPAWRPSEPGAAPTLLLIYRDAGYRVRFCELSPLAWRLLERIEAFPQLHGRAQLQGLALDAGIDDLDTFLANGQSLLQQMHAQGAIGPM
ncbi:putative DNA-binding domain-containing protein [Pseudomonas chlororaphis]|uniref:HvfC family RiPP maturation protein n=1 Tax=Pseudomonas chlororaphis TaxID=587753 RepID=UPI000E0BFD57|nr:putative DNA-binding domain-containing protein [Pseudomonas chlororaphis]WDH49976.1 putative DNA-binding domain-containing protein [Pseudomonas chlororaphis]WDH61825.1 putative DNA-binding domain-containing protein [Pseudomonas chlororaphis]WQE21081.1 putative DNA-binding domain-containing protein [Pseudomonas chlororaphis]